MMILTIMMMKEPNGYSNAKEKKVHLPMMMMITVRYNDDGGVGGGGGGDVGGDDGGDDGGSRGGSFADNNNDGGGSNGKEAAEPKVQFRIWSTPGIST